MNFKSNQLILFFSLPFYPLIYKKSLFLNGHVALGIDGKVYQIFNPNLLKSDFILSKMPIDEWLYNDSDYLVDKNKESDSYSYVHLYKKSELKRTTVFYAVLNNICPKLIKNAQLYFDDINNRFIEKKLKFNLISNNCSTLIASFFYKEKLLNKSIYDLLPALFFNRVVINFKKNDFDFFTGVLFKIPNNYFKIRKICLGLFYFNVERSMVKWLKKYNFMGYNSV